MTLPVASNSISLNQVNVELGVAGTTARSMNDTALRTLFGVASGTISMSQGWGKSNRATPSFTFTSSTANASINVSTISGYVAGKSDITVTVNSGVYLYATSTGSYGLNVTGGTAGDTLTIVNNGFIMGQGGDGDSTYSYPDQVMGKTAGGPAINITLPTTINTQSGYIGGGGGGGGGSSQASVCASGGGGAGGGSGGLTLIRYNNGTSSMYPGGAGGGIGSAGGNVTTSGGPAGGGGRIMPGVGGSMTGTANGFVGGGGGAGGGGAANAAGEYKGGDGLFMGGGGGGGYGASGGNATNYANTGTGNLGVGGSAGNAGSNAVATGTIFGGPYGINTTGAAGGKAINTNGQTVTWVGGSASSSRVYGIVG